MVGHEAEGVHSIVETVSPFLQKEIEAIAVLVGKKDRLASVAAENDVVESTGAIELNLVNLSTS